MSRPKPRIKRKKERTPCRRVKGLEVGEEGGDTLLRRIKKIIGSGYLEEQNRCRGGGAEREREDDKLNKAIQAVHYRRRIRQKGVHRAPRPQKEDEKINPTLAVKDATLG